MKDLQNFLEKKRRELEQLKGDVEALERARQLVTEAGLVRKRPSARPARAGPEKTPAPSRTPRTQRRKPAVLSIPDAAEQVIREAGRALHLKEIVDRVSRLGVKPRTNSVSTVLQRYVRQGRRFTRPAPNTFDVAERKQARE